MTVTSYFVSNNAMAQAMKGVTKAMQTMNRQVILYTGTVVPTKTLVQIRRFYERKIVIISYPSI